VILSKKIIKHHTVTPDLRISFLKPVHAAEVSKSESLRSTSVFMLSSRTASIPRTAVMITDLALYAPFWDDLSSLENAERQKKGGNSLKVGQLVVNLCKVCNTAFEKSLEDDSCYPSDASDIVCGLSLARLFMGKASKFAMTVVHDEENRYEMLKDLKAVNGVIYGDIAILAREPWNNDTGTAYDDDDSFYYHSWRNDVVTAFGTLSSFFT